MEIKNETRMPALTTSIQFYYQFQPVEEDKEEIKGMMVGREVIRWSFQKRHS
jgi:hypothetical protein